MALKIIIAALILVFAVDTASARKHHHHRHHHSKKEVTKIPIPEEKPVASMPVTEPTFNDIWNERIPLSVAKGK